MSFSARDKIWVSDKVTIGQYWINTGKIRHKIKYLSF